MIITLDVQQTPALLRLRLHLAELYTALQALASACGFDNPRESSVFLRSALYITPPYTPAGASLSTRITPKISTARRLLYTSIRPVLLFSIYSHVLISALSSLISQAVLSFSAAAAARVSKLSSSRCCVAAAATFLQAAAAAVLRQQQRHTADELFAPRIRPSSARCAVYIYIYIYSIAKIWRSVSDI